MAKKTRDFDSSLELLLDTMCNTFGGVMFIAIAIVVLMSMMTNLPIVKMPSEQDCSRLEKELKDLMERNTAIEKELLRLENHPAHSQIKKILQNEKNIKILNMQSNLLQTQAVLKTQDIEKLKQEQDLILRRFVQENQKKQQLENEQNELKEKLAEMQKQTKEESTYSMTFRVMEEKQEMPYFFLIGENKIWRLGPLYNQQKRRLLPHSDCDATVAGNTVFCTPIPGKGIPLLENGALSQAALDIITNIPPKRISFFSIAKDSIQAFCMLREFLKSKKITHGVDTLFNIQGNYSYTETKANVKYEY